MKTPQENPLKVMYDQAKSAKLGLLFAGLMILVKDTADYINANGLSDQATEGFRQACLDMLNYDRFYWEKFGPDLLGPLADAKDAKLPFDIAKKAAKCEFDIRPLLESTVEQEWTRAPGWHFFETYTDQIKADILGDRTLDELKAWFCNGDDPKAPRDPKEPKDPFKPFATLIERLARRASFGPAFWYPLMLYVVLLLKKTDFRTLS